MHSLNFFICQGTFQIPNASSTLYTNYILIYLRKNDLENFRKKKWINQKTLQTPVNKQDAHLEVTM